MVTLRVIDHHAIIISAPVFPDAAARNLCHGLTSFLHYGGFKVFRYGIRAAADAA